MFKKNLKRVLAMVAGAALCATVFMGLKLDGFAADTCYQQEIDNKYAEIFTYEDDSSYLYPLQCRLVCEAITNPKGEVTWEVGDGLSKPILQILAANPDLTLRFKFTYDKVDRELVIKGSQVVLDKDADWYGPVSLINKYGK